jgi:hypothetical protein
MMVNPWIRQGRPLPSHRGHRKSEYQDKDNIIRSQSQLSANSLHRKPAVRMGSCLDHYLPMRLEKNQPFRVMLPCVSLA